MPLSLEECAKRHPRVWYVTAGPYTVVFVKPNSQQWRQYKGATIDGVSQRQGVQLLDADEAICKQPTGVVVSHSPAELEAVYEDWGNVYSVITAELEKIQSLEETKRAKEWRASSLTSTTGPSTSLGAPSPNSSNSPAAAS